MIFSIDDLWHPPARRLMLCCALAPLLGACRSAASRPEGEPLPFHVALIPTQFIDKAELSASAAVVASFVARPESEPDDDMRLGLYTEAFSAVLEKELGRAFVRVTLLEAPDDDGYGTMTEDEYWQKQAIARGADVLVRTLLQIDPKVRGERNEKFWLNLPLFLLGGPMCYFVGDRTYEVDAVLEARFYDVTTGHEVLEDYSLLPVPLQAQFEGADLRFLDRADGAGDYALSILIPAGFLASKTEDVEKEIEGRVPELLGRELATQVFEQRRIFEKPPRLGTFELDWANVRVERSEETLVSVDVPISATNDLLRYELLTGRALVKGGTFETRGPDGRYRILDELRLASSEMLLAVHIFEGENERSYTLPIEASGQTH